MLFGKNVAITCLGDLSRRRHTVAQTRKPMTLPRPPGRADYPSPDSTWTNTTY
ncbi:hypothetical protein [Bordetella pertussis]|uniref:hypothetical protein n=1 Tax=Bordetella pertussis TaxID=520 RepID=UPI001378FA66|nr:hypothetical protein [Bordetella pertussis]